MRTYYGWRAIGVLGVLALGCRLGIAQIAPRYVLELPVKGVAAAVASRGSVQTFDNGQTLMRYQDLSVLVLHADTLADEQGASWPQADLAIVTASRNWMAGCKALAEVAARRKLMLIVVEQDGAAAADPPCYPMRVWDTLSLRKGATQLRATAMAGQAGLPGVGGFLLELGGARLNYRVYLSAEGERAEALLARLPGADMLVLQDGKSQQVATRRRGSDGADLLPASESPVAFAARRR